MAHFAELNSSNEVLRVIVVSNDDVAANGGDLHAEEYTYDPSKNKFIAPKPYASWSLDSSDDWQAPVNKPDDGKMYVWNETDRQWDEV